MTKQLGDLQAIDSCAVLLRAVAASNLTAHKQSDDQPDISPTNTVPIKGLGAPPHRNADRPTQDAQPNIDTCANSPGQNQPGGGQTKRKKKQYQRKTRHKRYEPPRRRYAGHVNFNRREVRSSDVGRGSKVKKTTAIK